MVSNHGGIYPRWRADGKELAYIVNASNAVAAVDIDTSRGFQAGVPHELFHVPPGTRGFDATPDLKRWLLVVPVEQHAQQSFNVVLNWSSPAKVKE